MIQNPKQKGFTLVELMIAMGLISILLISITMTAIQAGKLYNRGLILKSVNESGRNIVDTIRRDFLQSNSQLISENDDSAVVNIPSDNPVSGRVCLGQYTYVWNYAPYLGAESSDGTLVRDVDGKPISLIRVSDENGSLCVRDEDTERYPEPNMDADVTHLLRKPSDTKDVVLGIHKMSMQKSVSQGESGEALYSVSFTVGTSDTEEIVDNQCKPPADNLSNMEFCAINQFDTIVRTNG